MPWKEASVIVEREKFVKAVRDGYSSVKALCDGFGISRKTGYKWLERFEEGGRRGLIDRSRARHQQEHQTAEDLRDLVIETRKKHPTWGPRKLCAFLDRRVDEELPAPSTVGRILKTAGLVKPRRRVHRIPAIPERLTSIEHPNSVWGLDFKGQYRLRNAQYCYPLTMTDAYSRYLLVCKALPSTAYFGVRPALERSFREYGLPDAVRSDNGTPFGSPGIRRLTPLGVWLIKIGVHPEHIDPGHPEQNGRHERMHRTLKQETMLSPSSSMSAQQRRFDGFRQEYNEDRPHEALGQQPPAAHYKRSDRRYPPRIPPVEYPGHYLTRKVECQGMITFRMERIFVSVSLAHETVGLVEVADGLWRVYFAHYELGALDLRGPNRYGRLRKVLPMCPV